MSNPVTARQLEVHTAIAARQGDERAAARDLGVSYQTVHKTELAYLVNSGASPIERVVERKSPSPMMVLRDVPTRLDAIEAALEAIAAAEVARDVTLSELVVLVRELNARQPLLLVERYATHRRQSDGGVGGKQERSGR
jgi:hypothetical protein